MLGFTNNEHQNSSDMNLQMTRCSQSPSNQQWMEYLQSRRASERFHLKPYLYEHSWIQKSYSCFSQKTTSLGTWIVKTWQLFRKTTKWQANIMCIAAVASYHIGQCQTKNCVEMEDMWVPSTTEFSQTRCVCYTKGRHIFVVCFLVFHWSVRLFPKRILNEIQVQLGRIPTTLAGHGESESPEKCWSEFVPVVPHTWLPLNMAILHPLIESTSLRISY